MKKMYCIITIFMCFFIVLNPNFLKADFRFGIYLLEKGLSGFDFSENREVLNASDPNCDMYWVQFEIPWISGHLIDLGKEVSLFSVLEAPDSNYTDRQFTIELNHVYVLKSNENCYAKILIISISTPAMLWVYQDDGTRNLNWHGTATGVSQETINTQNSIVPILWQNYPNPFNSETIVALSVPPNGFHQVKLTVFNIKGQSIAGLLDEKLLGGTFKIKWDGKTKSGVIVPSGIYFINAMIDQKYSFTKQALLIK